MAWMIAPRALGRALALARAWMAPLAFLPDLACWRYPGLETVVAAGWLAATAVGAAAGAATGVLSARSQRQACLEAGCPLLRRGCPRGGTLVSAQVADAERSRLEAMLDQSAIDLRDRSAASQRRGGNRSMPAASPTAEEVRKERALYRGGLR